MKTNRNENKPTTETGVEDVKVIAFYRVSTEKQDLTRQEDVLNRVLAIDGYTPDQVKEIGKKESGVLLSMAEREGINEMKAYIETHNVKAVYVHELSRLSRRASDTFAIRDYLLERHIQLVCINPAIKCFTDDWQIDRNANMIFGVMASMAENEGSLRKERCATGRATCKAQGHLTHAPKFGWDKVKNGRRYKAVINEEEAALVRRIYKMYIDQRMPANAIGRQLRDEGIKNRKGKRGNCCFVWKILNDTDYTGSVVYPAIVSREEYEQAQERLRSSHTEIRYQYNDGLIWYGKHILYHNGLKMHITNRDGAYKSADDRGTLNINVVDSLLLWLADKYQREFEIDKDEMKDELRQRIATYRKQLEIIEAEREDIQKRIRKANNQYDADALTDEQYKDKIGIINAKKRELGDRERHTLTMIDDTENEIKSREQPRKWVDIYSLSDVRRAEIIRMVVNRIDVERGSKQGTYFFHIKLATGTSIEIFSETMKHKYYMATDIDIENTDTKAREEGFVSEVATDENGNRFFVAGYTPHRVGDEIKVPWVVRLESKTKRLRRKKMVQYIN